MHISHVLFTVIVLNFQSTVCTDQFRYVYEPTLNNQRCISTEHRFTVQTASKLRCGQICSHDGDCNSFFFSSATSECTGCVSVMSDPCSSCEPSASGTVYYRIEGSQNEAEDCFGIRQNSPSATSGVYTVRLSSGRTISVYCDMDTDGGGWTVFQYRHNGAVDFYRTFQEYTDGFGDVNDEFWLGLQNIHEMAPPEEQSQIILYVEDKGGSWHVDTAFYFAVGPSPCFQVTMHAGDSNLCYSHGACFSTKDYGSECAVERRSGWWFYVCTLINPNGLYITPGTSATISEGLAGIVHEAWRSLDSLAVTKIMFRKN